MQEDPILSALRRALARLGPPVAPLAALRFAAPLVAALLVAAALAAPALAQSEGGGGAAEGGSAESAAGETAGTGAGAEAQTLIRILRDPQARDALIAQLEGAAPSGAAEAARTAEDAAEEAGPEVVSFGRRIAEITQEAAQGAAEAWLGLLQGLSAAPERLSGLDGAVAPDVLLAAARDLGLAILVTYAVFIGLRFAARPLRGRLAGVGQGAGFARTLLLSVSVTALDALIVLAAWAAGYAIVTLLLGEAGGLGLRQSLYLNAFVAVELARIAIRLLLRPESGDLRLIGVPDAGARYLSARLSLAVALLGYGQLLAVPIVNLEAGWRAGQAVGVAVSLLAILIAFVAVLRHRAPVARWLTPPEAARSKALVALARLWHVPALIYLAGLFVIVLVRPSNVLWPTLEASGKIVAAVILGMIVNSLLARRARAGFKAPERVARSLPLLERRVNAVLPKALLFLRLAVVAVVVGAAFDIVGLWDARAWLASGLGLRLAGGVVGVALILLGAFLVWLAFASWIDWRLNPEVGRAPTSRETTLLSLLRNAGAIALIVITLMFALSEIGLDIAPLLASAGVLGLAIGFGAQKMVQDVITGIFIQLENSMNVGDVVTVNATTGTVEKLTIRSVSLRDLHGVYHLIPFSSVDMVSNYMREFAYCVTDMGIAYREEIEDAKQAMLEAFERLKGDEDQGVNILGELEWFGLNAFGDSAVVLRTRIKTLPGTQWGVGRAYNAHLKAVFDERGIEIPFPHQTLYFGEDKSGKAPPLHLVRDDRGERERELAGQSSAPEPTREAAEPGEDLPDRDEG
jgi:small conductance mechanosensitive channel